MRITRHMTFPVPRILEMVIVAIAVLSGVARAQQRSVPTKAKNIVLVHGAWADGSAWNGVIELLQRAGYTVTAVQLGLSSLDEDVAKTREVLAAQTGPTLLVAHSFAGAVITRLERDAPNVVGLVYESAFAPDSGETLKGLLSQPPQPAGAAAIRPDKQGFLWIDPAGYVQYFAPDVPPIQARVMAATQKPIAAAAFFNEQPFGPPAWRYLPTWYLITTNDQMVPPPAQQLFARRMGATTLSLAGSHASMVSHPREVATFIEQAAQGRQTTATHGGQ
ncbi:MAG TPA: alpha/beta hydrolase [Gemmatimonadales bacterium]|nr:alpha/beta hydrolase [Gemmatimonadales bacterium]